LQRAIRVARRIIVHVQDRDARTAAQQHHANASSALKRFVDTVAVRLRPKPDLSLVNEKFSDSFERERTELLLRNRW
jgi:hypothetical protein